MMRRTSDLTTLQQGVDVALHLPLLVAVLGHDLGHEIVPGLERGQILLGELASLRTDVIENELPGAGIRGDAGHVRHSKIEIKISFEWSSSSK